ncbi:PspC domain-containing protein [Actinomyces sp. 2119]|uniref:PspC domain-containing protein n=1 Tax=Actinomyces lilanjuaniae TaxID=2321394 RepID=A0ABM6Z553_9ACTO|nr:MULTISPECIES: PspC domain-containing protein [Actinomyces]AYD90475.1 PspC domain-containing protein [Actinomyces lilanjuaniae]RJF40372.1 PspC domain-containing protein [Actinomyces sp. 2119]
MTQQRPSQQPPPRPDSSGTGGWWTRLRTTLPARSRTHRILGGVCGGLARAWGTRPRVVRVGVLLLGILPGPMWAVYVLAWVVMPLEGTVTPGPDHGAQARW